MCRILILIYMTHFFEVCRGLENKNYTLTPGRKVNRKCHQKAIDHLKYDFIRPKISFK